MHYDYSAYILLSQYLFMLVNYSNYVEAAVSFVAPDDTRLLPLC
jgi:hypothetical protein